MLLRLVLLRCPHALVKALANFVSTLHYLLTLTKESVHTQLTYSRMLHNEDDFKDLDDERIDDGSEEDEEEDDKVEVGDDDEEETF